MPMTTTILLVLVAIILIVYLVLQNNLTELGEKIVGAIFVIILVLLVIDTYFHLFKYL